MCLLLCHTVCSEVMGEVKDSVLFESYSKSILFCYLLFCFFEESASSLSLQCYGPACGIEKLGITGNLEMYHRPSQDALEEERETAGNTVLPVGRMNLGQRPWILSGCTGCSRSQYGLRTRFFSSRSSDGGASRSNSVWFGMS